MWQRFEIKGGDQEVAAMIINFDDHTIGIIIIENISLLPFLVKVFLPWLFKFLTLGCYSVDITSFCYYKPKSWPMASIKFPFFLSFTTEK